LRWFTTHWVICTTETRRLGCLG